MTIRRLILVGSMVLILAAVGLYLYNESEWLPLLPKHRSADPYLQLIIPENAEIGGRWNVDTNTSHWRIKPKISSEAYFKNLKRLAHTNAWKLTEDNGGLLLCFEERHTALARCIRISECKPYVCLDEHRSD